MWIFYLTTIFFFCFSIKLLFVSDSICLWPCIKKIGSIFFKFAEYCKVVKQVAVMELSLLWPWQQSEYIIRYSTLGYKSFVKYWYRQEPMSFPLRLAKISCHKKQQAFELPQSWNVRLNVHNCLLKNDSQLWRSGVGRHCWRSKVIK